MPLHPLGTIIEIVESTSSGSLPMKVAYAYEDLVFMEHNAFILQFTRKADELLLHKNIDADMDEIEESIAALKANAAGKGITLSEGSLFSLEQASQENVSIKFMEKERDA